MQDSSVKDHSNSADAFWWIPDSKHLYEAELKVAILIQLKLSPIRDFGSIRYVLLHKLGRLCQICPFQKYLHQYEGIKQTLQVFERTMIQNHLKPVTWLRERGSWGYLPFSR